MKANKQMLWIGIAIIVIAAILLVSKLMGDSTFPAVLGILGVIFIGASGHEPLKRKKK